MIALPVVLVGRRAQYDERALNGKVNQKQVAIRTALEKRLDSLITPTLGAKV
jgi:hypothetical protein